MPVPNTYATATTSIPLSQLDTNFATPITIGNTAVQLGNTITTINNTTLVNTTISSGNATVTKITVPTIDAGSGTALSLQSNSTTGLYIDTSQNVGIGTSSPSSFGKFAVIAASGNQISFGDSSASASNNGYLNYAGGSGALVLNAYSTGGSTYQAFSTSNSGTNAERMRIDSSGNLLVGTTTQTWDERLGVLRTTNAVVGGFYSSSSSYTSSVIRAQTETPAGTGWYLFEGRSQFGNFQYGIRGNGTVATSDARRKKNIEPARSYIDDICKIRVVKYNWKLDEDTAPKELGWIAQEVAEVFPNMVVTHHDGPNDDQEVLLLKKEVFVPMLMKCVQELSAKVDAIKAEFDLYKSEHP